MHDEEMQQSPEETHHEDERALLEEPILNEDETQIEASQEVPEIENKAKKFGHLSKEEWTAQGRDPSLWKSPEQFVQYGDSYNEVKDLLKSLKSQLSQKDKQIDMLVDYHKRSMEQTVKQAKSELEQQINLAKQHGDMDALEKLTQHKIAIEMQSKQQEEMSRAEEQRAIDGSFLERNRHWFNEQHPELIDKAKAISSDIKLFYPNISYAEIVRRTEERMRFEHPEIVVSNRPAARPPVTSSQSGVNKSTANAHPSDDRLYHSLTAEQKAEYQTVKRMIEKVPGIKYSVKEFLTQNK